MFKDAKHPRSDAEVLVVDQNSTPRLVRAAMLDDAVVLRLLVFLCALAILLIGTPLAMSIRIAVEFVRSVVLNAAFRGRPLESLRSLDQLPRSVPIAARLSSAAEHLATPAA